MRYTTTAQARYEQSKHYQNMSPHRIWQTARIAIAFCIFQALAAGAFAEEPYRIAEFREIDREYLKIARDQANERCASRFGTRFRGNKQHDLPLLQRLLDEKHVTSNELALLQGMGVILGEVLRSEYPLDWVRYIDNEGASRALQLRHTEHFIFPITAISRRASVDAAVDIAAIYQAMRSPVAVAYER